MTEEEVKYEEEFQLSWWGAAAIRFDVLLLIADLVFLVFQIQDTFAIATASGYDLCALAWYIPCYEQNATDPFAPDLLLNFTWNLMFIQFIVVTTLLLVSAIMASGFLKAPQRDAVCGRNLLLLYTGLLSIVKDVLRLTFTGASLLDFGALAISICFVLSPLYSVLQILMELVAEQDLPKWIFYPGLLIGGMIIQGFYGAISIGGGFIASCLFAVWLFCVGPIFVAANPQVAYDQVLVLLVGQEEMARRKDLISKEEDML